MTFGTGTLRRGSTGTGVGELQQWLIDRGFLIDRTTPGTTFDDGTEHAAKAFQMSAGIGVDGVVGDGTRTAADAFTGTAASAGWHPSAARNIQVDAIGGSFTTTTRRGVLHTTEGTSLPSYTSPPHFTVGRNGTGNPVALWQHYPVTVAARALGHPAGTGETNRFGAVQIEIITAAAGTPTLATTDPDLFQALGLLMRWIEANGGVANVAHHAFDGVAAYGQMGTVRMTDAAWQATTGWVGHQHVPHNSHWDPGQIDIAALLTVGAAPATGSITLPFGITEGGPGTVVVHHPTIRATTRQLSNAFPSLTFAVDTAGRAYFEVLLTTDRSLFDPANTARRTAQTFYASRQDGLKEAAVAQGRYVAPVPVIRTFAESSPLGGAIFYTAISYADDRGGAPLPAADPVALARTAPSVTMLAGFRGHTATDTLGVPLSMLRPSAARARTRAWSLAAPTTAAPPAAAPTPAGPVTGNGNGNGNGTGVARRPVDPIDDAREGEDGYDFRMSAHNPVPDLPIELRPATDPTPPPVSRPAPAPPSPPPVSYPAAPRPPAPSGGNGYGYGAVLEPAPAAAASYDDGWGELPVPRALDSTFPRHQRRPAHLLAADAPMVGVDDEYQRTEWSGEPYAADLPVAGTAPVAPVPAATPTGPVVTMPADWRPAAPALSAAQKRDVIEVFVGPDTDLYTAMNPDGEHAGAAGVDHPAYQRYHLGLSFGIGGFSQDSGELGQLLALLHQRDPAQFDAIFGPAAPELLEVTNRPGPLSRDVPDGRSARVQPVAGADLWVEPWTSRFVQAGGHRPFQGAQIELAAGLYLDPALQFAADLGLATQRGLAVVFDRCAHRGVTGGLNWIIESVGPLQTPILVAEALHALGFADVESFQRSQPDLLVDEQFGPLTHAALTGALRSDLRTAAAPPVPILGYRQMLDALAQRATGQLWGDRIVRLNRDPSVADDLPPAEAAA